MTPDQEAHLRARLAEAESLLADMEAYFDARADTDDDQHGPMPNAEAKFQARIEQFLGVQK